MRYWAFFAAMICSGSLSYSVFADADSSCVSLFSSLGAHHFTSDHLGVPPIITANFQNLQLHVEPIENGVTFVDLKKAGTDDLYQRIPVHGRLKEAPFYDYESDRPFVFVRDESGRLYIIDPQEMHSYQIENASDDALIFQVGGDVVAIGQHTDGKYWFMHLNKGKEEALDKQALLRMNFAPAIYRFQGQQVVVKAENNLLDIRSVQNSSLVERHNLGARATSQPSIFEFEENIYVAVTTDARNLKVINLSNNDPSAKGNFTLTIGDGLYARPIEIQRGGESYIIVRTKQKISVVSLRLGQVTDTHPFAESFLRTLMGL